MKPNQQLKYLNAGSAHTPGCFKAIKTGVCYCLTKLTTVNEDSVDLKLDEIYPEHFDALNKANLLKDFEAPTLGVKMAELELASKDEVGQATKKRRERETGRGQSILRSDSATTGEPRSTRQFAKSSRGSHP
jgi:hypothetical protein